MFSAAVVCTAAATAAACCMFRFGSNYICTHNTIYITNVANNLHVRVILPCLANGRGRSGKFVSVCVTKYMAYCFAVQRALMHHLMFKWMNAHSVGGRFTCAALSVRRVTRRNNLSTDTHTQIEMDHQPEKENEQTGKRAVIQLFTRTVEFIESKTKITFPVPSLIPISTRAHRAQKRYLRKISAFPRKSP